jgi:1,4-dihydroxy-2-naphthoyl-CoA synthase
MFVFLVQLLVKKVRKEKEDKATGYKTIDVNLDKNVLVITLDRPKKKNAFSKKMYKELERALRAASENEEVAVIHLKGSGDYYSSGDYYDFKDDTISCFPFIIIDTSL